MKILFVDTVHPLLKKQLTASGHQCDEGYQQSRAEVLQHIQPYDGVVIRSRIHIDKELIDHAKALRFIARAGAGMENIDVAYAESKGIKCLNAPEGNRNAVAEHALGMLLSLFNNLVVADKEVRNGEWQRERNRGIELDGKTVGIIGYGNMGSAFAKKLAGFDCEVLAYDKYKTGFGNGHVKESSPEEIFEKADVVSLHVPLTPETTFMVNDQFIQRFKNNIYVINTARGLCLRTSDLVKNMKAGKVLGACLDVNEYEDSSFEKTGEQEAKADEAWEYLLASDSVVLSPHIAGWTYESNEKMARVLFEKIEKLK